MNPRICRLIIGFIALIGLSGCTVMKPNDFAENNPKLVLEEYFLGKTRAWGIFEDRFGKVKRQFVVDIEGTWDGHTLILDENFSYSDGFCDSEGNRTESLPDSSWSVNFSESNGVTTVYVEIKHETLEDLEKIIEMGFKEGFTACLEQLTELLNND